MTATPPEIDKDELHDRVIEMLAANGKVTDSERWRLLLMLVSDIRQDVKAHGPRLSRLENYSIIIQAKKHPKITGVLTTISILIAMFFHQIAPWVMTHLALLAGLK